MVKRPLNKYGQLTEDVKSRLRAVHLLPSQLMLVLVVKCLAQPRFLGEAGRTVSRRAPSPSVARRDRLLERSLALVGRALPCVPNTRS